MTDINMRRLESIWKNISNRHTHIPLRSIFKQYHNITVKNGMSFDGGSRLEISNSPIGRWCPRLGRITSMIIRTNIPSISIDRKVSIKPQDTAAVRPEKASPDVRSNCSHIPWLASYFTFAQTTGPWTLDMSTTHIYNKWQRVCTHRHTHV